MVRQLLESRRKANVYIGSYFEPFDNQVREVFIKEVKYSKSPATNVKCYFGPMNPTTKLNLGRLVGRESDVAGAIVDATPNSATIAVANVSTRGPVVLAEDGGTNHPMVYGRIIERTAGEITVNKTDPTSRLTNGDKKFEVSPAWITNRGAAEGTAAWIIQSSKNGNNIHTMSVYSNPLVEIGDIVTVTYPLKNITANTKFLVRAVRQIWNDGIETEVELVKI